MGIGDWGLGIGDWGLGNPQSPIPNPQSPLFKIFIILNGILYLNINFLFLRVPSKIVNFI
jgi:hypothetical protein